MSPFLPAWHCGRKETKTILFRGLNPSWNGIKDMISGPASAKQMLVMSQSLATNMTEGVSLVSSS